MSARPPKVNWMEKRWIGMTEEQIEADCLRFGGSHHALMRIGFGLCVCHERAFANEDPKVWRVKPGLQKRRHRRK